MKNKQKGFTLIELLVVIAIIGILATIVLTSLQSARAKAQDAKVQAQLSSMRAQAELFYSDNGSYGTPPGTQGDCTTGDLFSTTGDTLKNLLAGISADYSPACYTSGTPANAWAVTAENSGSTTEWCADSNGDSKVYTTGLPITVTSAVCP